MTEVATTLAIDHIDKRRLDLIRKTVAKDCTDAEIASFLELAQRYDLDPFAREIWCVKNKGRLLMMVGRDGLRKVALRQGLTVDADVVHENDEFKVERTPEGRKVTHIYGHPKERGAIVGAWCEVAGVDGNGFFYAPLEEYLPKNASEYSPWTKQVSVMILAAAERQALRQATPLSGLLAEGEDESAGAREVIGSDSVEHEPTVELPAAVLDVLDRAKSLGHHGIADRAAAEMQLSGQPDEYVDDWVVERTQQLDRFAEIAKPENTNAS